MGKRKGTYELTKAQENELRRLYQFANRRIKTAMEAYEKAGLSVAPHEVTGGIQIREQWETEKYAISRTKVFSSAKEYRQRLSFLRSFERMRPSITEYTEVQREKTISSMETSMGAEVPEALQEIIRKMSAPELSIFWKKYSNRATKMGVKYASGDNMDNTITEFFSEDKSGLAAGLSADIGTRELVRVKQPKGRKKKKKAG